LPALSEASLHAAVNVPTPGATPPVTASVADVLTPDSASLVLQPAAGTAPRT
jgi:hypothetical protein